MDPGDLLGHVLGHVVGEAVRTPPGDPRDALASLPGSDGQHAVGGLLRLLPVHGRADADLELAHPAVGRRHRSIRITSGRLEGVDERRPPGTAATGEPVGLVGDDAVDVALADQVEQLAELRSAPTSVAVARGRRRLDQLGDDVDLEALRCITARLDLHVEGRGALTCDRLAGVDGGTSRHGRHRTNGSGTLTRPFWTPGHLVRRSERTKFTNTRNTPTEALERAFALRVLRYRLRTGSGGAGQATGGEGIERDLMVLEDVTVNLITERRTTPPPGLGGGKPGAVGENWFLPAGEEARAERVGDKCTLRLSAGDVLRMLTPRR